MNRRFSLGLLALAGLLLTGGLMAATASAAPNAPAPNAAQTILTATSTTTQAASLVRQTCAAADPTQNPVNTTGFQVTTRWTTCSSDEGIQVTKTYEWRHRLVAYVVNGTVDDIAVTPTIWCQPAPMPGTPNTLARAFVATDWAAGALPASAYRHLGVGAAQAMMTLPVHGKWWTVTCWRGPVD